MKRPVPSEHEEQAKLIRWWDTAHSRLGPLFAIPNGGQRSPIIGRKLKAEGVRPGVPDLFLAVPRLGFHGLFIELKRRQGGSVRRGQKEMHEALRAQGYAVQVCRGADEAMSAIGEYLKN